jgi:Protein of unknown function (DUF5663)
MIMNTIAGNVSENKILQALDFQGLSTEDQEELLLDLNSLVFKGSLIRLMESMDEKTKDEFEALIDSDPDDEEVEAFIEKNVPDAGSALQETLEDITNDILAVTK